MFRMQKYGLYSQFSPVIKDSETPVWLGLGVDCQAQPQLNSTQSKLKLRLRLVFVPPDPPTQPGQ